jgi:hypothetical protein
MIMGSVKAATGNFNQAYLIAIGFAAFGLLMTFLFRAITKERA